MDEPNDKLRAARRATPSRRAPGEPISPGELADEVNRYLWDTTGQRYQLDGHAIARYERGKVRWPSAPYRAGLRAVLGAGSDADLGFRPTRRGNTSDTALAHSKPGELRAVTLGRSPAEFLADTTVETPVPASVGWSDVDQVRTTTRAVALAENLFGGGLSAEAALGQLRWAGNLLDARATTGVRRDLHEAVGNLAGVVAFAAFDIADYRAADRCFDFALWAAEQASSWALRANTLAEMSRKAAYLNDLDDALSLIEFAQVRADRLTATARAMLWTLHARILALTGRHREAEDDIRRADEHFAHRDPAADPPWLVYYDDAEHQGSTGKALIPLARHRKQPELAAGRLQAAIDRQGDTYPRSRAFSRTRLAALMMAVGDIDEAVPIGRQAVDAAATLRSRRVADELRGLALASRKHAQVSDVRELQRGIAAVTNTFA
ncbi:tetratricopeptide repeat protein [Amycolatopsis thermoflava]|uniref:hypothetical protein n=1 Tax=Amycolatopsis thermoflava TaxID=84480 RepID=UPI00041A1461|nr:hypothetical protein [Amycolatopsis thermoflava]